LAPAVVVVVVVGAVVVVVVAVIVVVVVVFVAVFVVVVVGGWNADKKEATLALPRSASRSRLVIIRSYFFRAGPDSSRVFAFLAAPASVYVQWQG
jgi:hypothetical protein